MMRARLGLAVLLAVAAGLAAQAPAPTAPPAFDAASVKPVHGTTAGPPSGWKFDLGRFSATGQTLQQLVTVAYSLRPDQVTGGDGWTRSDRFTITAVCSGTAPPATMHVMLQTLLARRFGLQVQREQRQGRVCVLAVAKGGAKLDRYRDDGSIPPMPSAAIAAGVHWIKFSVFTYSSGSRVLVNELRFRQAAPAQLAGFLAHELQTDVLDQTGMSAAYNFGLVYAPVRITSANTHADDIGAPRLAAALKQQLGLILQSEPGTVASLKIVSAHLPMAD